jgi:alginate O-acetyltransferase complex protein AlgI
MVFTSLDYALLLGLCTLAYWALPAAVAPWVLGVASVVFYAFWSVPYLALVGASIALGWLAALAVQRTRARGEPRAAGAALAAGVALLLALLAWFKYADFLLDLAAPLLGPHAPLGVELPLAISFYTFQILAYLVDVYRGQAAERSLPRFALFVGFFPQLVAGPIVRARQLLPQLRARARFDPQQALSGLLLLAYGVVKKAVFADNLAVYVDGVYGAPGRAGGLDVALATLAFGAQIYCDFSGYTDIARGSARLLGIELPENFRSPYVADSLADFWRRWHVTLSTWLRDYLYIPLGGNRVARPRLYANLLLTMLLGGLWHGASLTFVLWGAYHGALLAAERALGLHGSPRSGARRALGQLATFAAVQLGWAIFRAGDLATLAALAERVALLPLATNTWFRSADTLPLVGLVYALHALSSRLRAWPRAQPLLARAGVAAPALAGAAALVALFGAPGQAFIYFRF